MLTVKKIAVLSQVTPDAIRYYVRIGLLKPKQNPENKYREFSQQDIKQVKFICQAQRLGFSLRDIKRLLNDADLGKSPCPHARQILQRRVVENKKAITELISLQTQLEKALKKWDKMPDKIPDGDTICHLIESF